MSYRSVSLRRLLVVFFCSVLILAIVAEICLERSSLIMFGVTVEGVEIGGLTPAAAAEKLAAEASTSGEDCEIRLLLGDDELVFSGAELGYTADWQAAAAAAYQIGRTGNLFERLRRRSDYEEIAVRRFWNEAAFRQAVLPLAQQYRQKAVAATVTIEASEVQVSPETVGSYPDFSGVWQELQGIGQAEESVTITVEQKPFLPYPAAADLAGWQLDHLLSTYTTYYEPNCNRAANIELFAATLNGTLLYPYDILSINDRVGERTADAGYLPAPMIVEGELKDDLGGGICQVVTTLYNALGADCFMIKERHAHSLPPSYVPLGADAAVVYGSKDFAFCYVGAAPILLAVAAVDGELTVSIYGGGGS